MAKIIFFSCLVILLLHPRTVKGRQLQGPGYQLTLSEAIQFAKNQNKWVRSVGIAETAAAEDRKATYKEALPSINADGSYQYFTPLTLFGGGLSHASTISRPPGSTSAALGVEALFNLYSGGRQRAKQNEQNSHLKIAQLDTHDQSGTIALQTAVAYLDLVRLNDQQQFILDQKRRALTRLANINSLYNNEKVTRSDVLRAQVALSNTQLALEQNQNDIAITNQRLDVLMDLPDSVRIFPADSAAMPKPATPSLTPLVQMTTQSAWSLQKANENIRLANAVLKEVESAGRPSVGLYGGYGLNYPNYNVFPAADQAWSIGFVGIKASYEISSLYHNKNRVAAARLRLRQTELQAEARLDDVRTEAEAYLIKYGEALNRISVNERSVEEALVNYRIQNTKYLNQLSLLTDLLDADNLYQESRIHLIRSQTDALTIYYRLLYLSGNL
ncbi:TolC family protein [Puia sp. P3]|uniref:TolC family protein n=1 Tax=Puia sp. P3 TaxID=3423952 RepID=UPI003D67B829